MENIKTNTYVLFTNTLKNNWRHIAAQESDTPNQREEDTPYIHMSEMTMAEATNGETSMYTTIPVASRPVRDLDHTRLMIQGSTTNPSSSKGNVDHRKSALYYATLAKARFFKLFFFTKTFSVYS